MRKRLFYLSLVVLMIIGIAAIGASADPALPTTCPQCKKPVTWTPLTEYNSEYVASTDSKGLITLSSGHYYLGFEDNEVTWEQIKVTSNVCIYMNGKTINAASKRAFYISGNGNLSLLGNGTVIGRGHPTDNLDNGGAINVQSGSKLNIDGPTISRTNETGRSEKSGGVIFVISGELNLYSGHIDGSSSISEQGAAIGGSGSGVINLYGGTVTGGTTTKGAGGAIYIRSTATLNIDGANVIGGTSETTGGAIHANSGTNLYIRSGSVSGGSSKDNGGCIYFTGSEFQMSGGTVTGGTTKKAAGSIYINDNCSMEMTGGNIIGGSAETTGGAIHANSGTNLYIRSGSVSGGSSKDNGGCIYFTGAEFQMSGGTVTGGTTKKAAGSIYVNTSMEMTGGAVKNGTKGTYTKGVYVPNGATITLSGNASIEELRVEAFANKSITAVGECTGTIALRGASGEFNEGVVIGNAQNANLKKANYYYNGASDYKIMHKGTDLVFSRVGYLEHATIEKHYCSVCKMDAEWIALTAEDCTDDSYLYTGHYYLAFEDDSCAFKSKSIVGLDRVCLDLRGKSLVANTRAFYIANGVLNIMDTVGGGVISGQGDAKTGTVHGGTILVETLGTLNLYSGKLTYRLPTDGRAYINRGGVVFVRGGKMNMYGGEISGGAASYGANIYGDVTTEDGVTYISQIGLYGGTVGGNVAVPGKDTTGTCIYTKGYVTLSGDPNIAELYPYLTPTSEPVSLGDSITIKDTFSGTVQFRYRSYTYKDVGNSINADISNANISVCNYATHFLFPWNGELLRATDNSQAYVFAENGAATVYNSYVDAIAACGENEKVLLIADITDDITITSTVTIDLNGHEISGKISGSGTLYCMDSTTDDFDVRDGVYGKITGEIDCDVQPVTVDSPWSDDNYLMITEGSTVSFHRVQLQITDVSLRPNCAGIYYHGSFFGDSMVEEKISSFGIILNAGEVPTLQNMETTSLYTTMGKELFNSGSTSCLLKDIMKAGLGDSNNASRAETAVYSNAYVMLKNGDVLFGNTVNINLQDLAGLINEYWVNLSMAQKEAFMNMFDSYENVMRDSNWSVSNAVSIANSFDVYETTDYTPYLTPWENIAEPDGKIHYYFMAGEGLLISSAQSTPDKWGDACLIVFPDGQTMLIDSGPNTFVPLLTKNLQRMGITRLDYVLITHPHSDHQGMFYDAAVLGTDFFDLFEIGQVFWRGGYDPDSTGCQMPYRVCTDLGIPIDPIEKGDVVQIGDVRMECLWPLAGDGNNLISVGTEINNTSIVVRFDYGEHSSIFTADLYVKGEKGVLECVDSSLLDADLLKVPHHGFDTSSSVEFLAAISPELAVATSRNPVHSRTLGRYNSLGIPLLDDRTKGYIEVVADEDGNMSYTTSRDGERDENTPDVDPDENEGDE